MFDNGETPEAVSIAVGLMILVAFLARACYNAAMKD